MTGRARRPRTGGSDDGTTPRRPRSRVSTSATSVRQAQQSITQAAQKGRPAGAGAGAGTRKPPGIGHNSSRRRPGETELPPGHRYDAEGFLRGPDGRYARDPNHVPGAHDRSSEYPSGYRESTHDAMAARYTDEGIRQGRVPLDANGNKIPHDQLTWRDEQGRKIPYNELTYDHRPSVVEQWNSGGNNTSRAERINAYNNVDNLRPMRGVENSAAGGRLRIRYSQEVGTKYSD